MTYQPDGLPSTYGEQSEQRLAAGWLSAAHPFAPAKVGDKYEHELFCDRLFVACATRRVAIMRGYHRCDLCDPPRDESTQEERHGERVRLGNGEVHVADPDGVKWTAPTLVYHYVVAHGYCPPSGFIAGILTGDIDVPVPSPVGVSQSAGVLGPLNDIDPTLAAEMVRISATEIGVSPEELAPNIELIAYRSTQLDNHLMAWPTRTISVRSKSYPGTKALHYDGTESWRESLRQVTAALRRHFAPGST
jgi:hypothetical protein